MVVEADSVRLVMLGPPGSGKGTQAAGLARTHGVPSISTGEMLRSAVAEQSEFGRRVESILASGDLVDDATMAAVVRERLAQSDVQQGFLLDGYPRTVDQAETLDQILGKGEAKLDAVVLIEVEEKELVRRALARQRADDTAEVIANRIGIYREKTEPLVDRYARQGLLVRVDGNQSIDAVGGSILARLEEAI